MPNLSDRIADSLIHRQVQTLRAAEGVSAEIVAQLRETESRIAEILKSKDLTRYTAARLKNTLGEIRAVLSDFSQTAYKTARREVPEIARLVAERSARDLNDMFNVDVFSNHFDARRAIAAFDDEVVAGQTMKKYWSKQTSEMTRAYGSVVRESILAGESPAELLKRVKQDPRITAKPGQIRTMVRSTTMQTANTARMEMYAENDDLVKGIQWLSTLDTRTSPICQGLDGLSWNMKKEPLGHDKRYPGPTAHPNCRSTQLPLLRSFAELAGRNKDLAAQLDSAMSQRTRASMDGQVSADLSYSDWLRTKGDDFARSVLGAKRFEMWRDGTLELRDMLDQRGNPLLSADLNEEFVSGLRQPSIAPPDIRPHPPEWADNAETHFSESESWWSELKGEQDDLLGPNTNYALTDYLMDAGPINNSIRRFKPTKEASLLIDSFERLPPTEWEMRVFRGVGEWEKHSVGDVFMSRGLVSTSYELDEALMYLRGAAYNDKRPLLYDIRVPKGARVMTGNDMKKEFILNHDTRFRVVGSRVMTSRDKTFEVVELEVLLNPVIPVASHIPLAPITKITTTAKLIRATTIIENDFQAKIDELVAMSRAKKLDVIVTGNKRYDSALRKAGFKKVRGENRWTLAKPIEVTPPVRTRATLLHEEIVEGLQKGKLKLEQAEQRIANLGFEVGVITSTEGNVLFAISQGERGSIAIKDWQYKMFKDKVFTHNHPNGHSFSLDDLRLASRVNLKSIRAVAAPDSYVYEMVRTGTSWPSDGDFIQAWNNATSIMYKAPRVNGVTLMHGIWELIAKELGLTYRRIPYVRI